MEPGKVIRNRYQVMRKIGEGSFGVVYSAADLDSHKETCLKIERNSTSGLLMHEVQVLRHLQGGEGFPQLYASASETDLDLMVFELLGPSLEALLIRCKQKLSLKSVSQLALQMIDRLQYMHSKGYLHRDIKPDNMCMGLGNREKRLYFIDFGLAKRFVDKKVELHIPYGENKKFIGTARYASLNSHRGIELSRRDDLESVAFLLIYLLEGTLPWQEVEAPSKAEKYRLIGEAKANYSCAQDHPPEFKNLLDYVRGLSFEQEPDYKQLKRSFISLADRLHISLDFIYDWPSSVILLSKPSSAKTTEHSILSRRRLLSPELEPQDVTALPKKRRSSKKRALRGLKSKCKGCFVF
jgi:serine/threonine protein kinase